jgi:hypothetical protein
LWSRYDNIDIDLTPEEKVHIKTINPEYFNIDEEFQNIDFKLIDLCWKFPGLFGKPILTYVRRIIVPDDVADETENILKHNLPENHPEVVPINCLI